MGRWNRAVVGFGLAGTAVGCGVALLSEAEGWSPFVAPVSIALLVAAFGWIRRSADVLDVLLPAFAVSYAAYVGLAFTRMAVPNEVASTWHLPSLDVLTPVLLVAGIPFAMFMSIVVAAPVSLIPRRRAAAVDSPFWTFVHERSERERIASVRDERTRPAGNDESRAGQR